MISELLKLVMQEHALKQVDLAEVLEVSLSRVKAMTSGRVKNLTREESELLIGKLGIRAQWLVTGEGPMHEDGETQDEFVGRMQAINRMAALVKAMPMRELTKMRLAVLMTGDPKKDGPLIAEAVSAEARGLDFATGEPFDCTEPVAPILTPRQTALLNNYAHTDEAGKKIIEATASAAAKPAGRKRVA